MPTTVEDLDAQTTLAKAIQEGSLEQLEKVGASVATPAVCWNVGMLLERIYITHTFSLKLYLNILVLA